MGRLASLGFHWMYRHAYLSVEDELEAFSRVTLDDLRARPDRLAALADDRSSRSGPRPTSTRRSDGPLAVTLRAVQSLRFTFTDLPRGRCTAPKSLPRGPAGRARPRSSGRVAGARTELCEVERLAEHLPVLIARSGSRAISCQRPSDFSPTSNQGEARPVRIVSLLPSLTELVCALGRGEDLVGVTHECDYPPEVARLPFLTRSHTPADATSAEIDELVSSQHQGLYELEGDLLAELAPDLILTQEQCDVCAVNEETVREAAARLPGSPHVESVNPMSLSDVFAMFSRVGDLLDCRAEAESIIAGFKLTAGEIARRRKGASPRRVLLLEWLDPPFGCGHWNPELIERAGGTEVIGRPGGPSRRITWMQVAASRPEVVIAAPCGFTLDRAELDARAVELRPEWRELPAVREGGVVLVDGSSFFSRPGPRLETSLRIAAAAIDPDRCGDLCPWRAPAGGPGWSGHEERLHQGCGLG